VTAAAQEASEAALAAEIERAVCSGRSALALLEHGASRAQPDLSGAVAFSLGRAAEEEESYAEARALFGRALRDGGMVAARAQAHLAHLDYYGGRFEVGLDRAESVARAAHGLAACEAHLYASANAIALNRPREALTHARVARNLSQHVRERHLRIDLRFRIARQITHVLVARGQYTEAAAEAETAAAIGRILGAPRHLGYCAYLRGYVLAARGDGLAVTFFRAAARHWGGSSRAFGRWLQYFWAMTLRDLGDIAGARNLRLASGLRLPWEEPLFELADGSAATPPDPTNCPADEVPFRLAARGVVHLAAGRTGAARADLLAATREFERCELHHYRRGAAMALAAAELAAGDAHAAAQRIRLELPALMQLDVRSWPWWHRPLVRRLAEFCLQRGLGATYWRRALEFMGRGGPAFDQILRARDLTEREIEVVRAWLAEPQRSRAALAAALGMGEASVRAHLNSIRRKLDCDSRRGAAAIRTRIAALVGTSPVG
jgi:DNA-binding CsgD family transcriptional regulator